MKKTYWCHGIMLWLFVSCLATPARSQQVIIQSIQVMGGDVIFHYELLDDKVSRRYSLYLFSSKDNFIKPLEKVTGDVGVDLAVGGNKKVIWHAKEELGADFKGDLAFELKGSVYVPFVKLDGFDDYKVFKRGKAYSVTWTGGRGDNVLSFELYKGDTKVKVLEQRPNTGKGTLTVPIDVKPGKNYRLKISDSRNKDEVVFTETFTVKRKIPILLKVGILLGIGTTVTMLTSDDGGEQEIPLPPPLNK